MDETRTHASRECFFSREYFFTPPDPLEGGSSEVASSTCPLITIKGSQSTSFYCCGMDETRTHASRVFFLANTFLHPRPPERGLLGGREFDFCPPITIKGSQLTSFYCCGMDETRAHASRECFFSREYLLTPPDPLEGGLWRSRVRPAH